MFATEPSGFEAFWTQFINYVYPATQIIYWLVMIAVAIYVASLLKKWVAFKTGSDEQDGESGKKDAEKQVSVEEFVE